MTHLTRDDVVAAAQRIAPGVARTPSAVSRTLSDLLGATVVLKFENLQFTGSFKERGALNRLLAIDPATTNGVVAMSAGNHALGVAYHASRLGIPATIVMPSFTPAIKVSRTRGHGARVVLHGASIAEASVEARRLEAEERLTFIHPFDDPLVIAGQGTIALEVWEDHPDVDVMIVPIGGGGLLAGIGLAAPPSAELVGVQSERYPAMVTGGAVPGGATIAEGIAVSEPGHLTSPLIRERVHDIIVVAEADIEVAIGLLVEVEKTVAEGAGAAGLGALIAHRDRFAGRTVAVVVTGGNIDARLMASVLLRGLVRTGRLVTLRVTIDDNPGSLAMVASLVAAAGGNIVDVRHSRLLTEVSIRSAQVELVIEVTDAVQVDAALSALTAAGFVTERLEPHTGTIAP
jgi:threonine dehydratase